MSVCAGLPSLLGKLELSHVLFGVGSRLDEQIQGLAGLAPHCAGGSRSSALCLFTPVLSYVSVLSRGALVSTFAKRESLFSSAGVGGSSFAALWDGGGVLGVEPP